MTVSTSGRDSAKKMECISKGIHTLNHFVIDLKPALNHLLHFEQHKLFLKEYASVRGIEKYRENGKRHKNISLRGYVT